jgi:hypothetical protein
MNWYDCKTWDEVFGNKILYKKYKKDLKIDLNIIDWKGVLNKLKHHLEKDKEVCGYINYDNNQIIFSDVMLGYSDGCNVDNNKPALFDFHTHHNSVCDFVYCLTSGEDLISACMRSNKNHYKGSILVSKYGVIYYKPTRNLSSYDLFLVICYFQSIYGSKNINFKDILNDYERLGFLVKFLYKTKEYPNETHSNLFYSDFEERYERTIGMLEYLKDNKI